VPPNIEWLYPKLNDFVSGNLAAPMNLFSFTRLATSNLIISSFPASTAKQNGLQLTRGKHRVREKWTVTSLDSNETLNATKARKIGILPQIAAK
jgi:hypothetical protein